MKLIHLFIFIMTYFSLIKTDNHLNLIKKFLSYNSGLRKLAQSNNKEYMLVGIWNYKIENNNQVFEIHFKYNENISKYDTMLLNLSIVYKNETEDNKRCSCGKNPTISNNLDLNYSCIIKNINYTQIKKVSLKCYNFSFYMNEDPTNLFSIIEDQVSESSFSVQTKKDIKSINYTVKYDIFNITNFSQIDNNIELNGFMNGGGKKLGNDSIIDFILSGNEVNASYNFFQEPSSNNEINETIILNPKSNINDHLNGKMGKVIKDTSNNNFTHILLFLDNTNIEDLLLYTIQYKESFAELIGFGGYQKLNNKDATSSAYFRGTPDFLSSMKNYMQFTALLTYEKTNLRNLEQDKMNITAIGAKRFNNNDIVIYNFTFMNTSDKTIIDIKSNNDYLTSDTEDFSSASSIQLNIISIEDINILNNDTSIPQSIEITIPVTTTSNSFSFGFKVNESLALEKNITASYLNYPSPSGNREEYECSLENKIYYYLITWSPKTDIYTLVRNVRIKVPEIKKSLRFLAEEITNRTLIPPADSNEIIDFQYNPDINTYGRRISKNKGLSAGAIAAIVLASIAAIVAVGIAIFFLNRMPTNPPVKPTSELQLQNSSAKIQN